jgi:hypothetical protein
MPASIPWTEYGFNFCIKARMVCHCGFISYTFSKAGSFCLKCLKKNVCIVSKLCCRPRNYEGTDAVGLKYKQVNGQKKENPEMYSVNNEFWKDLRFLRKSNYGWWSCGLSRLAVRKQLPVLRKQESFLSSGWCTFEIVESEKLVYHI